MRSLKYILRRLLYAIPTLLAISILTFALSRLAPGDPVRLFTFGATDLTQQDIEALRHTYGLDQPAPVQYGDWLWSAVAIWAKPSWRGLRPASGPRPLSFKARGERRGSPSPVSGRGEWGEDARPAPCQA